MIADSNIRHVTVFGGSGFLGSEIVRQFTAQGITTRVAVRHPNNVNIQEQSGQAGEILPVYADVRDETSVGLAMDGCDAVVNAVGLYVEDGAENFEAVHERGALNVKSSSGDGAFTTTTFARTVHWATNRRHQKLSGLEKRSRAN